MVADANLDERPDIIAATVNAVTALLGNGRAFMPAPGSTFRAGPGAYRLATGDVNEDGRLDVAVSSFDGDSVARAVGAIALRRHTARTTMTSGLTPRALRITVWTLALLPTAWFALFCLFVFRARLTLGHWPTPDNPDPKDLGFSVHHMAIVLGLPLFFVAPLILLLFIAFSWREMKAAGARPLLAATTACVTFAVLHAVGKQDAGKFFYWFAD